MSASTTTNCDNTVGPLASFRLHPSINNPTSAPPPTHESACWGEDEGVDLNSAQRGEVEGGILASGAGCGGRIGGVECEGGGV